MRRCLFLFSSNASSILSKSVGRRKVLAWYGIHPIDLQLLQENLEKLDVPISCCYPDTTSTAAQSSPARWGGVGTPAHLSAAAVEKEQPVVNTASSSSPSLAVRPSTGALPVSAKGEMLCFSQWIETPDAPGGVKRTTYVLFAEGSIVGWDVTYAELVALKRSILADCLIGGGKMSNNEVTISHPTTVETINFDTYSSYKNPHGFEQAGSSGMSSQRSVVDQAEETEHEEGMMEHTFIDVETDTGVLADEENDKLKIPFSYALAQSVKLDAIDSAVTPITSHVKLWQKQLASSGKLLSKKKQLRQAKSQLLGLFQDLNFNYNIAATPKIFWSGEFQHLRPVYKDCCEHLEIEDRGSSLKFKIDTVDDAISYLHSEVHVSSSEFLTWVIIWLIFAELCQALGVFELCYQQMQKFAPATVRSNK